MNLETENVIRKVQKLLNLGNTNKNSFEHEADAALTMANKLMEENNLTMSDVKVKELEAEGAKDIKAEMRRNCVPWERMLGGAMGKLFQCKAYRHQDPDKDDCRKMWFCMAFIGVGTDPDVAQGAYETLHQQIIYMGKNSGYRGSEQGTYMLGVANAIFDRCNKLHQEAKARQTLEGTCKALVLVKETLINDFVEKTYGRMSRIASRGHLSGSYHSRNAGYQAGQTVGLPSRTQIE